MDEEASKIAEPGLEASLRKSAKTFNQWVLTSPTTQSLSAIDENLVLRIATLPLKHCETILTDILALSARFSFLSDVATIVDPGPAAKHAISEAKKSVDGLVPICYLILSRLGHELRKNTPALNVLIVREGDLLSKFNNTAQLVPKALNDLSSYSINTYNKHLEENQLSGKKTYPNQYPEEIWSLLGEAIMNKFPSQTARDRTLADKVRDLFRAVKGDEEIKYIPNAVAMDLVGEDIKKDLPENLRSIDAVSDISKLHEVEKTSDLIKRIEVIPDPIDRELARLKFKDMPAITIRGLATKLSLSKSDVGRRIQKLNKLLF